MIYEKYANTVAKYRTVVTGTPKPHAQRTPADLLTFNCYFCWETKSLRDEKYYVEKGTIDKINDDGTVDIAIEHKIKYHPEARKRQYYNLYPVEFGSTPEQAVENKL